MRSPGLDVFEQAAVFMAASSMLHFNVVFKFYHSHALEKFDKLVLLLYNSYHDHIIKVGSYKDAYLSTRWPMVNESTQVDSMNLIIIPKFTFFM